MSVILQAHINLAILLPLTTITIMRSIAMPKYRFMFYLPSKHYSKTYRVELQANMPALHEEGPSELGLSFDAYHQIHFNDIQLNALPRLLLGDEWTESFKQLDNEDKKAFQLKLDLNVAAGKHIALGIVDRLLSLKDIGNETPQAAMITELALKIKHEQATDIGGHIISSQKISHDLFMLYQTLGGTKTTDDFEAQAPIHPPVPMINFGAAGAPTLYIASSAEEDRPKSSCCLIL